MNNFINHDYNCCLLMIVPIVRSSQYYYDRIIDINVTTVLVYNPIIHFKILNFNIMKHNIF